MANQLFSISGATDMASKVARYLPTPTNTASKFAESISSFGSDLIGGVSTDVFGDLKSLLNLQVETQAKMQSISMSSNIEKSKHESRMAAIRNVRVS